MINLKKGLKNLIGGGELKEEIVDLMVTYRSKRYSKLCEDEYPRELSKIYKKQTGEELNLQNPKTYNEKIQWMKLYDNNPLKTQLADKYLMKKYVSEAVGSQYVVDLLGVWDKAEDIDFNALPKQFVLKVNHSCHTNIVVKNKKDINENKVRKKLNHWLKINAEFMNAFEMQYRDIPRKIIAERYIESGDCGLDDYKVWCFEGKAYYVQYLTDRSKGLKMAFYDAEWNKMPFTYSYPLNRENVAKPNCLSEMLNVAEKLSQGFHHVRVDFYLLNDGSPKVGELTFTPAGGTCLWSPKNWDEKLGELIHL